MGSCTTPIADTATLGSLAKLVTHRPAWLAKSREAAPWHVGARPRIVIWEFLVCSFVLDLTGDLGGTKPYEFIDEMIWPNLFQKPCEFIGF